MLANNYLQAENMEHETEVLESDLLQFLGIIESLTER